MTAQTDRNSKKKSIDSGGSNDDDVDVVHGVNFVPKDSLNLTEDDLLMFELFDAAREDDLASNHPPWLRDIRHPHHKAGGDDDDDTVGIYKTRANGSINPNTIKPSTGPLATPLPHGSSVTHSGSVHLYAVPPIACLLRYNFHRNMFFC